MYEIQAGGGHMVRWSKVFEGPGGGADGQMVPGSQVAPLPAGTPPSTVRWRQEAASDRQAA